MSKDLDIEEMLEERVNPDFDKKLKRQRIKEAMSWIKWGSDVLGVYVENENDFEKVAEAILSIGSFDLEQHIDDILNDDSDNSLDVYSHMEDHSHKKDDYVSKFWKDAKRQILQWVEESVGTMVENEEYDMDTEIEPLIFGDFYLNEGNLIEEGIDQNWMRGIPFPYEDMLAKSNIIHP